jgi:hypothetical protein
MAIFNAVRLVDGLGAGMPGDRAARQDCPVQPRELRKVAARWAGFRDLILHLHEKGPGRFVGFEWSSTSPEVTFIGTVGRNVTWSDRLRWTEVLDTLATLQPWLEAHRARLRAEFSAAEISPELEARLKALVPPDRPKAHT